MTVSEYTTAGFNISQQVAQTVINTSESDVFESYVKPIIGSDADAANFKPEIMALAFCLLLRRNVVKTRFGSETKNNQYGTVLNFENQVLQSQIVGHCVPAIRSLKAKSTLTPPFENVSDIIGFGYYIV